MKKTKKGYGLLLALTILLTLSAVSTIAPSKVASKECLLGYKAHCTFAPISTIILVVMTAGVCSFRRRKFTEK